MRLTWGASDSTRLEWCKSKLIELEKIKNDSSSLHEVFESISCEIQGHYAKDAPINELLNQTEENFKQNKENIENVIACINQYEKYLSDKFKRCFL